MQIYLITLQFETIQYELIKAVSNDANRWTTLLERKPASMLDGLIVGIGSRRDH